LRRSKKELFWTGGFEDMNDDEEDDEEMSGLSTTVVASLHVIASHRVERTQHKTVYRMIL
jgi:hypothetical protein